MNADFANGFLGRNLDSLCFRCVFAMSVCSGLIAEHGNMAVVKIFPFSSLLERVTILTTPTVRVKTRLSTSLLT